jgi:hypothetical protein
MSKGWFGITPGADIRNVLRHKFSVWYKIGFSAP